MLTKFAISLVVVLLSAVQAVFIYALEHGAAEQYLSFWKSFGLVVPEYTKFVYRTAAWWTVGPVTCLLLLAIFLYRKSQIVCLATCALSGILSFALYWSTYAPHMLVRS